MCHQQAVGKEERARRVRDETHRDLAGALDPLMGEIGIQEVGEIRWRHARGEVPAIVGQSFVMISGDDADLLWSIDDQREEPHEELDPKPLVVEEVAQKDDPRRAMPGQRGVAADLRHEASSARRSP